jgi:superfamily II DNA or RNA helicase
VVDQRGKYPALRRDDHGDWLLVTGSKLDLLADTEKAKTWRMSGGGISQVDVEWDDLRPVDPPLSSPQDVLLTLIGRRLEESPENDVASIESGKVDFKAFQFRPLMKYLREPGTRLLIADETGLGKTIETAYILVEELAKGNLDQVLVLCPAHLQDKWQYELSTRFGLHLDIVSGHHLVRLLRDGRSFHAIASIDAMRGKEEEFRSAVRELPTSLDFLVIDEVHHMIGRSGTTLRREMGRSLSLRAKRAVGLSATPVQIEREDLVKVLEVIDPGNLPLDRGLELLPVHEAVLEASRDIESASSESEVEAIASRLEGELNELEGPVPSRTQALLEDLGTDGSTPTREEIVRASPLSHLITRTRRGEVGERRSRRVENVRVDLDDARETVWRDGEEIEVSERNLFERVDELLEEEFHFAHRRQLSSSLPGTLGLLRAGESGHDHWVERLESPESAEGRTLSEDVQEECRTLRWQGKLLAGMDTKLEVLRDVLDDLEARGARKAVVFTQWKPTIRYLEEKASTIDHPTFIIRGRDDIWTRQRTCERFEEHDGFCVLLSSDVIAEGIDLVAADAVINYDLPLNPQKLSQRIGRVDRVSQPSEEIHIVNLLVEGGLDSRIHSDLHERLDAYRSTVGSSPRVLEAGQDEAILEGADELVDISDETDALNSILLDDSSERFDERILAGKAEDRFVSPTDTRDLLVWTLEEWNGSRPSWLSPQGERGIVLDDPPSRLAEALSSMAHHGAEGSARQQLERGTTNAEGWRIGTGAGQDDLVSIPVRHPVCEGVGAVAKQLGEATDQVPFVEAPVPEPPFGLFVLMKIQLEWTDPIDPEPPNPSKGTWRAAVETEAGWEEVPIRRILQGLREERARLVASRAPSPKHLEKKGSEAFPGSDWISLRTSQVRRGVLDGIEDEIRRLRYLGKAADDPEGTLTERIGELEEALERWRSADTDRSVIEVTTDMLLAGRLLDEGDGKDG